MPIRRSFSCYTPHLMKYLTDGMDSICVMAGRIRVCAYYPTAITMIQCILKNRSMLMKCSERSSSMKIVIMGYELEYIIFEGYHFG